VVPYVSGLLPATPTRVEPARTAVGDAVAGIRPAVGAQRLKCRPTQARNVALRRYRGNATFGPTYVDTSLEYDVRAHIAITSQLHYTPLRVEQLADKAQCSDGQASDTLQRLLRAGSVERLLNGSRSFRLTNEARQALQSRLDYRQHSSLDESWDKGRAYLDTNTDIGRSEAAELLGVKEARASTILSALFNQRDVVQPVGNARGRGVRYRLSVYR
jgi:hypothetical protein